MADPNPLTFRAQVGAALRGIPGLGFYDGYVPEKVPVDERGYVRPYVVLFAGDGSEVPERDLSDLVDLGGLRWDFQTTAVGASAAICAAVGYDVRRALTNLVLGRSHVVPNPDGFNQQTPIRDSSETPARFMLPHQWRLETT